MRLITIENTAQKDFHQFMLGAITPRPIALVSTRDEHGIRNLAPFSYFNAVSSIPPILMVSVGRKQDGGKKDTLLNAEKTGEFVVNMVPHSLLRQMALTSVQLPPEEDEFDLAGLNALESTYIKAHRVKESPIHFECRVRDILELGPGPGESSLIFGDVLCMHIDERIIDARNRIDAVKLGIVGRLGRSHYCRVEKGVIETVVVPQLKRPIGFEALPDHLKRSDILSANDLASLAASTELPDKGALEALKNSFFMDKPRFDLSEIHQLIRSAIKMGDIEYALSLAYSVS